MAHFTQRERDKLDALKKAGHSQEIMADIIGCNQSTISRELNRNGSLLVGKYTATSAQARAELRRNHSYDNITHWHDDKELLNEIITQLKDGRSPEQISWRRKEQGLYCISHQSIYNYISEDKNKGGRLYKLLRYQGKKYKWIGFDKTKTKIPNRRDIEDRPKEVDDKQRYWDWETDLVVSSMKWSGAVATFAERRSMYFQAIKVESKSADEMVRASTEVFTCLPEDMKQTMTHDNGTEICKHEEITETLRIDVYCARPYRSCDRGLNEWMNRELRRFFPKGTDFSKVLQKEVDHAVKWLNNCPRKSLKYRTPKEVFDEQLAIMHLRL
jgi:transposase, IS30 family